MRQRVSSLTIVLLTVLPASLVAQTNSVHYLGIEVSPLGGATLSVVETHSTQTAPAGSRLYVGNLSFNGSDGFRMHIGSGLGAPVEFPDLPTSFPTGGQLEFRAPNAAGYVPCVRVATSAAGGVTLDPDFADLGASSYRAEIWDDGEPVVGLNGMSGPLTTSLLPMAFEVDLEGAHAPVPSFPLPATSAFKLSEGFHLRWASDVAFMDALGTLLGSGDELRFYPNSMTPLGSVETIDVLIATPVIYTMAIDDMALLAHGKHHRARKSCSLVMYDAENKPVKMTLTAGIVGGVEVEVPPSDSLDDLIWDLKDGFVAGDTDEFSVTAELLVGGQGVVGKVSSLHDGSRWNVTPDFSGSGSPDARVELYDATGNLLGVGPNVSNFTIMTNEWAVQTGVEENETLALRLGFASPVSVTVPGLGVFTASLIKMHSNASKKHKYFAIVDRSTLSAVGGECFLLGEPNTSVLAQPPLETSFAAHGLATGKRLHGLLVAKGAGARLGAAFGIAPCVVPTETPPDQFGVQWAPLGPPSANTGETEWAFLTRHAGDAQPGPTQKMSILMDSDGAVVNVSAQPGPPEGSFEIILKNRGRIVAQYVPPDPVAPFATLPDWPIAAGYQVLQYDDKPWSMWINLGYEMDVQPPDPIVRSGASRPLTKADLIEVIATNVPNPGPPEIAVLSARLTDVPFLALLDDRPTPTFVGPTLQVRSVLHPAYPNPFNPQTKLSFELATGGHVSLKLYAVDGSYVATVHEGALAAGAHTYEWNGANQRGQPVASGVYFAELRAPDGTLRTKLSLLK
jgi:hypothetical protein